MVTRKETKDVAAQQESAKMEEGKLELCEGPKDWNYESWEERIRILHFVIKVELITGLTLSPS